jgi:hypothetical protein
VPTTDQTDQPAYCSYESFGVRFFEHAVTPAAIVAAMSGMVGDTIEIGPLGVGPGKIATVTATGQVGTASATRTSSDPVTILLSIPADLRLTVGLAAQNHRFRADLTIPVTVTARAAEPLRVIIDVEPPHRRDIVVNVRADGLRATALQYLAGVDAEIARYVAQYVTRQIAKPHIKQALDIDVAAHIDKAYGR